jgi:hypothetical protein
MKKNRRPAKIDDPRQMTLFGDLECTDPLAGFYRRLRKIGATLTYDRAENNISVCGKGSVPAWIMPVVAQLRPRIVSDLLRVEHGIEPTVERESLGEGSAVLHRLPTRRPPECGPPVRQRTTSARRGPGAA